MIKCKQINTNWTLGFGVSCQRDAGWWGDLAFRRDPISSLFPSQPGCMLSRLATEIWRTIAALANPALTEFPDLLAQQIWAMKLSSSHKLFSSCQRPDNKTGILFQQTLMSIFLFAQSRQLVAIRDMLVGECVWLRRWHMTSQSWHTGRWRDSTSSIRFQKEKWIKKTILKARRCLYEWSLM